MEGAGAIENLPTLKGEFKKLLAVQDLDRQIQGWEQQRKELAEQAEKGKARGKAKQNTIKKYNGQLLELKSNEAYATMLLEIKHAQEDIAKIEEKILGLMEGEEAARRKFEEDARELAKQTTADQEAQARILAESKEFEAKVAAQQTGRAES